MTYIFRIVVPFVDYYVNFNFIVSEKCEQKDKTENLCLGKCYLSKQVKKQIEIPEEKENKTVQIEFVKIPHLLCSADYYLNSNKDLFLFKYKYISELYNLKIPDLPPPKSPRFS